MPSVYLGESWEWSASALSSHLDRTCTAIRVGWWGLRSPSLRFTRQPGKGKGLGKGMEWERVEHARDLGKFRRRSLAALERASAELGRVQARGVWHRAWTCFSIYKLNKFLDGFHAACAPMTSKADYLWSEAPAPIESENTSLYKQGN